jgi:hypothetical protein
MAIERSDCRRSTKHEAVHVNSHAASPHGERAFIQTLQAKNFDVKAWMAKMAGWQVASVIFNRGTVEDDDRPVHSLLSRRGDALRYLRNRGHAHLH